MNGAKGSLFIRQRVPAINRGPNMRKPRERGSVVLYAQRLRFEMGQELAARIAQGLSDLPMGGEVGRGIR
jgi:hypothetical protein